MTTHELARKLLVKENRECEISVDTSESSEDYGERAFGSELIEIIEYNEKYILCWVRYLNTR